MKSMYKVRMTGIHPSTGEETFSFEQQHVQINLKKQTSEIL